MAVSDESLVGEVLEGRLDAFDTLMERYQRAVFRLAYGFCRDREDAMELTQETFLKAYRGLPKMTDRAGFKPWLMRVAANEAVNWQRRRRRRISEVQQADAPREIPTAETQHGTALERQRSGLLLRAMDRLNPRQRLALELRYYRELPIREVATALECTEGTAKSILFRGIQKLREGVQTLER